MEVVISALLTLTGLIMLCFGGNWLVSGGVNIAKRFHISDLVIGMTVVAYGTSTPELAASIAAAGEHSAIILGNVVGSNIANIGMVIGISAVLIPLAVSKSVLRKEIPIMIGVSILLVVISIDGHLSQYDGILLIASLGIFMFWSLRGVVKQRVRIINTSSPKDGEDSNNTVSVEVDTNNKKGIMRIGFYQKSIVYIALGVLLLYVGAILTVDNAVILAQEFGLSERVIGLTVIAIGTSLPELVTSIVAIKKGHTDIGVGNIIGSNIYNILMIMGVGVILGGVVVSPNVYVDYTIMIVFSMALLVALKTGLINRTIGVCLAVGYVVYLAITLLR